MLKNCHSEDVSKAEKIIDSLAEAENTVRQPAPPGPGRESSRKIARRVIENIDRAFSLASELSACDDTDFDHADFVCSMCHAEAAILRGVGWERNYETGEIKRKKGEA